MSREFALVEQRSLYAYESLTLGQLVEILNAEGRVFRAPGTPFPRSSVHNILQDRGYIGELEYKGQWYPGRPVATNRSSTGSSGIACGPSWTAASTTPTR